MTLAREVIAKKRDGFVLSSVEIEWFVAGLTNGMVSDAQAAAFAMAVYFNDMDLTERVALTLAMRDSGRTLDWSELDGPVADKHSTGGVGDNVSLVLAPMLSAMGIYVPMIAGRGLGHTGGTLDKFDAIPGYMTAPDEALFRHVVRRAGCAIIGQTNDLAPADRRLYAIRDVTATVENISLITASILSKKLAAGLDALILDVKTGSGAFMATLEQSQALAQSLVDVASGAGLKTAALITDMNQPLASAAGNSLEMRNAIGFMSGTQRDPALLQVTLELAASLAQIVGVVENLAAGRTLALEVLDNGDAIERFAIMVAELGGPIDLVEHLDRYLLPANIIHDVFVDGQGIVVGIDTKAVGMAVVALGGGRLQASDSIDHSVGFDQLAGIGKYVDRSTPIARIHARDEVTAIEAVNRIKSAYRLGNNATHNSLIVQTILPVAQ